MMHIVIQHQIDEIDKASVICKVAVKYWGALDQNKSQQFEEAEMQLIAARNLLIRLNEPVEDQK